MINKKTLDEINSKIEAKQRCEEILRDFESPYVETTIGLIVVNSASKDKAQPCEESTWLHRQYPHIESALKTHASGLLKSEVGKIDAWLSERLVS